MGASAIRGDCVGFNSSRARVISKISRRFKEVFRSERVACWAGDLCYGRGWLSGRRIILDGIILFKNRALVGLARRLVRGVCGIIGFFGQLWFGIMSASRI